MLHRIFILLLFFIPVISFSQDLTGTWERTSGGASVDYAKIVMMRQNNTYIGYTYDEGMGHCTCNFQAEYNTDRKKLKGVNKGVIEKTAFHGQSRYNLNYEVINGQEYLKGTVSAKSVGATLMSFGLPMFITYRRVSQTTDTTEFVRNWLTKNIPLEASDTADVATIQPVTIIQEPVVTAATIDSVKIPVLADSIISEKNKRITDTISIINTHEKELVIKLMDNGVVDGDMVSIIHNGKVIAERIGVTETPYEIKIPLGPDNQTQEIILVAHNVGSIPPNTALVVIDTPSKQYRLTASTDLSKNAMIIFKYKE